MRTLLFACLLLFTAGTARSAPNLPPMPDLDVTHISMTPRPPSYQPAYFNGYGHPVVPSTNQVIPLEQAQAINGDTLTFKIFLAPKAQLLELKIGQRRQHLRVWPLIECTDEDFVPVLRHNIVLIWKQEFAKRLSQRS